MSEDSKKFYVTTPIYYVNARPHIGHAYTTIVADVLARRHRLLGEDTFFLTGTDEHGQKIERSAGAANIPPQQFADQVSAEFRSLWDRMGLTFDQYIRTTDEAHKRGVQKLFSTLYERGHIYLSSYTGQYSIGEEMFVEGPPGTLGPDGKPTETVTEENFFFRLSEFQLPLLDLIESDRLKITPDARKNEILSFLRGNVSALLTNPAEDNSAGVVPALQRALADGRLRVSAAQNPYIPGALKDLSISRSSFTWGIPVPEPAASLAKDPHIIYVWLDALANYMTAVGYGDDSAAAQEKLAKYWPADLHLVGKEIIRQHCIYWPAFLLAAGLPLPQQVVAHGWLLFEESKMSKSRGNIVRTETILDAFGNLCPAPSGLASDAAVKGAASAVEANSPTSQQRDLFAADVLRYFLLREIPFGQDGSFSFDALITRYNADLANGYGNLVSRTLKLLELNLSSVIPEPKRPWILGNALSVVETDDMRKAARGIMETATVIRVVTEQEELQECLLSMRFDQFTLTLAGRIKIVDIYLTAYAPWKLAKSDSPEDRRKMVEVLYTAAESIRIITALLYPILPYATASVWRQLGLGDIEQAARNGELNNLTWGGLQPGTKLGPLSPIFPRADKGLAQIMADMESEKTQHAAQTQLNPNPPANAGTVTDAEAQASDSTTHPGAAPRTGALSETNPGAQVGGSAATTPERAPTPTHSEAPASGIFAGQSGDSSAQITIDDFAKVELRVAKVLVCERIPKADKLLRLEVDLGYEKRQILSGIAEWYTPEDLIGRRIVVITNLAPRKMRGLESHGMLLAASAPTVEGEKPGKPALATFLDSDDLPLGARLK